MEDAAITDDHALMTAAEAFGAGVETTSTTLLWILAYLLHHPQVSCGSPPPSLREGLLAGLSGDGLLAVMPRPCRCRSGCRRSWTSTWAASGRCVCPTAAGSHTWTVSSTKGCGSAQSAQF